MTTLSNKTAMSANEAIHDPLQACRSMNGLAIIEAIASGELPPPPMAGLMPLNIHHWSAGHIELHAQPQAQFYNGHGSVHGGWIMTMLDTAMALAAQTTLGLMETCPSTETSVKFVRPVTLKAGKMHISGQVINKGKSLITLEGRIVDATGKLYAHGTSTCMVLSI